MHRALAAATVGALVLAAGAAPTSAATTSRREAIAELLEHRADAVRSGDKRSFLATLGDGATPAFRRAQARAFDNLQAIPLGAYSLAADWGAYGDLARASDVHRYPGADEVVIPLTVERYRIEGYDTEDVRSDLYLTFVERAGDWGVEGDSDLDDLGFLTQRNLWDFGPVETAAAARTFVIAASGTERLDRIGMVAGQALERVDAYWDRRWPGKVPIYAPADPEALARIIQATYPVENYVAFSFWTGGEGENPGTRIIVNPDGFAGASEGRALSILTHELTHVATLPSSGPFTPRFVEEGLAQYVQYDGSASLIAQAGSGHGGSLPDDNDFFVGDQAEVIDAYNKSLSAIGMLVERWGSVRLERLYVALGRRGNVAGTARYHVDRVFRRVLGVDLEGFERLWASSIG